MGKIINIPLNNRPREKATRLGIKSLSDVELLAIIIGSGTNNFSAIDISNNLIDTFTCLSNLFAASSYDLKKCKGISNVKSLQILAIKELFLRTNNELYLKTNLIFSSVIDVYNYVKMKIANNLQEFIIVLYLNIKNRLLYEQILSIGDESSSIISNKLICKTAIEKYANKVIIAHNHPSGNPIPSCEDQNSYKTLMEALKLINVKLLDSIVIGDFCFYSINNQQEYKVNQ